MATDKWLREPGIAEIIRYFDAPEHNAWHLLNGTEVKILHDEIRKCGDPETGFVYAAKNYFWITTKDGSDTLLRLTDTQELVWETMRWMKLRGRGIRLLIIKGRQLYVSTLIEAILAWLCRFNPNYRGLVVSYNDPHAAKLFSIILHIYDQLPWWLRPMIGTRLYQEGLHLINPDPDLRRIEPGLNSRITVQGANQNVGVAEGETINGAHCSEFGSYDPIKARKVIMGDFRWALPDAPNTFAVLETRVRQASKFAERLWESQSELGDNADWHPLFIPVYFDRSHFIPPNAGWKPEPPEKAIAARAAEEWRACSNCGQVRTADFGGADLAGIPCRDCKTGVYAPYVLQDGQMNWLYQRRLNAEKMGEAAVVEMQQSLATNPQEAFASVTETVFSKQARDWVSSTASGKCLAEGYMAADGVFHAPRRKYGEESAQCWAPTCKQDHTGDPNRYLKIWEMPVRGARYAISVDVAAGLGGSRDYSYIFLDRLSRLPEPDVQVAAYRCNTITAYHLADLVNALGRWYNNALAIVDYTNHQTTGDQLLNYFHYPNIYRWFQSDALKQQTNRWHWIWNNKNKESGWQVLDGWLRDRSIIIKDPLLAKELRHFQRLPDGSLGAPDSKDEDGLGGDFEKIHDDSVMTCIQLVIAAHQQEGRRTADLAGVPQDDGLRGTGEWTGTCSKCQRSFPAQAPCERDRCPYPECRSFLLKWRPNAEKGPALAFTFEDMGGAPGAVRDRAGASEEFSFGTTEGLGGF